MSSYDNPAIIKDLYGVGAWAKAAGDVTDKALQTLDKLSNERAALNKVASDKKELYFKSFISVGEKMRIKSEARFDALDKTLLPPTLVEQLRESQEYELGGGVDPRTKIDYGRGNIWKENQLKFNSGLPDDLRKEYDKDVKDGKDFLKDFLDVGVRLEIDRPDFEKAMSPNDGTHYIKGKDDIQYTNMLRGLSTFNEPLPKGYTGDQRYYKEKNQIMVDYTYQVHKDNPLATLYANDPEKYKVDEKTGMITIKETVNMTEFDGNIANPITLKRADYTEDVKKYVNGSNISKSLQHVLTATTSDKNGFKKTEEKTFLYLNPFNEATKATSTKQAELLADVFLGNPEEGNAILLEYYNEAGLDYDQLLKDGKLNKEKLTARFLKIEENAVRSKYGVGQEYNKETQKMEYQKSASGYQIQMRKISEGEIEQLVDQGVVEKGEIKPNSYQPFYIKHSQSEIKKKEEGSTDFVGDSDERWSKKTLNLLWNKDGKYEPDNDQLRNGRKIPGTSGMMIKYLDETPETTGIYLLDGRNKDDAGELLTPDQVQSRFPNTK